MNLILLIGFVVTMGKWDKDKRSSFALNLFLNNVLLKKIQQAFNAEAAGPYCWDIGASPVASVDISPAPAGTHCQVNLNSY